MKNIIVDCYEVIEPDGAGQHEIHVAYAADKSVAEIIAKLKPTWPRYVRSFHKEFMIPDSVEELQHMESRRIREGALAKLSFSEKRALGLL